MNHTCVIPCTNVPQSPRTDSCAQNPAGTPMDWVTFAVIIAATILATLFAVAAFEYDRDSRHRP